MYNNVHLLVLLYYRFVFKRKDLHTGLGEDGLARHFSAHRYIRIPLKLSQRLGLDEIFCHIANFVSYLLSTGWCIQARKPVDDSNVCFSPEIDIDSKACPIMSDLLYHYYYYSILPGGGRREFYGATTCHYSNCTSFKRDDAILINRIDLRVHDERVRKRFLVPTV